MKLHAAPTWIFIHFLRMIVGRRLTKDNPFKAKMPSLAENTTPDSPI